MFRRFSSGQNWYSVADSFRACLRGLDPGKNYQVQIAQ